MTVNNIALLKKLAKVWLHMLKEHAKPGKFYLGELDIQLFITALKAWEKEHANEN